MAEKKIVWTQKTASGSDTLYPRTVTDNVYHDGELLSEVIENISEKVADEFVKRSGDSMAKGLTIYEQTIGSGATATYKSAGVEFSSSAFGRATWGKEGFSWENNSGKGEILFPLVDGHYKAGTLALISDITKAQVGLSNVQNVDQTNASNLTSGTIPRARLPLASQTENGAMSADDKKNLDTVMEIIGSEAGDADNFVNTVREILDVFSTYPEGTDIFEVLSGKADTKDLANYVKKAGDEMTGNLNVKGTNGYATVAGDYITVSNGTTGTVGATKWTSYNPGSINNLGVTYNLPTNSTGGTFALLSDLPTIPSWVTSATAGGDLTGTYPNPTIGSKKVTTEKIADGAVTATQLASDSVTTVKILNGNVTNAKLDDIVTVGGTYSVVTYNTKGRITAGAQLFTVGTDATIPNTVPTGGFYLQEIK